MLQQDEHVLYVARALQVPPFLHTLGMGHLWVLYHQTLVVLTDRRLVEVLLEPGGKTIGTRVRAYDWGSVKTLKQGFASITLTPARGKRQVWKLPVRGDRKLLKLLVPRLQGRLLREGEGAAVAQPVGYCSGCGAVLPARPTGCSACGTQFRSSKIAAWLSVAFPGAGLLYTGHPLLATGDFLGELLLFGIVALGMAQAGNTAGVVGFAVMGVVFFVMTKLQSAHLTQILTARTRPDDATRRRRFITLGRVGGALSGLALVGIFMTAGTMATGLAHDLEVVDPLLAWSGSRVQPEWGFFADDPTARSQWTHQQGPIVTLFAYPLASADDRRIFRTRFGQELEKDGKGTVLVEDDQVPEPFEGFRYIREQPGSNGEPLAAINYFIFDPDTYDIHQLFTVSSADDRDAVESLVRDLLQRAQWIAPNPPDR